MKKTFCVTVPTTGWFVYEVEAEDQDEAFELIRDGKAEWTEHNSGDWADESDWEVEED